MGNSTKFHDKLAPDLAKKSLTSIGKLLLFIGKPFYILLSYLLIGYSSFIYITGRVYGIISKRKKQSKLSRNLITLRKRLSSKGDVYKTVQKNLKKIKSFIIFLKHNGFKVKKQAAKSLNRTKTFNKKSVAYLSKKTEKFPSVIAAAVDNLKEKLPIFLLKIKLSTVTIPKNYIFRKIRPVPKLKILAFIFGGGFLLFGIGVFAFWLIVMKDLPSPKTLTQRKIPVSTKIYDRNGILLYTVFKDENRTPVALNDIPIHVRLATIAIEDAEFYSHPGFSVKGIARAFLKNLKEGEVTGGSTITQQLVKNALLSPEKTLVRKLKEVVLAVQVELTYDKNEILEMYLNEVSYGGTAYGIQEAARTYLEKDVKDITLAEAALLAGLPKSPTRYSPVGSDPEISFARQKDVLNLMKINGFITGAQQEEAQNEKITFAQSRIQIKAPHFVFYVKEILEEKYGREVVEKGGLEVVTTLDYGVQELAEQVVKEEVQKLSKLNVSNGAVVVLDPKTGEILAMVGSKDYFDTGIDGNVNVAIRPRQPGSSIKVVNYAHALSNGLNAATVINDSPITFLIEGQPPYTPKNYEGEFRGRITLRSALAESRNIPAVKVLATYGVDRMIEMGKKMGITTWSQPSNYGLSLTLGGGEVKLLELAEVYAVLANYGNKTELVSTLKVTDYKGKVLEEFSCNGDKKPFIAQADASGSAYLNSNESARCTGDQVLDPRVSFIITDILRDNSARAPTFGSNSLLIIPKHSEVAVKTGTSNELRDNLAIGYTQNYVVAAWVGNNDNSQMARIASGVTGATPIWNKIMSFLLTDRPNDDWPVPPKIVQLPVCPYTGTLACSGCPIKLEWFLEENKPDKACSPEWFKEEGEKKNDEEKKKNRQIVNPGQFLDLLLDKQFGDGVKRRR